MQSIRMLRGRPIGVDHFQIGASDAKARRHVASVSWQVAMPTASFESLDHAQPIVDRDCELKDGSSGFTGVRPQPAAMRKNDRSAY